MINSILVQEELILTQIQLLTLHNVINVLPDTSALQAPTDLSSVQTVIIAHQVLKIINITLVHLVHISL
jgi:hypothetical protein